MSKRLYVVTISLEYAALAESEEDAKKYISDALRDDCMYEDDAEVVEAAESRYCLPNGWDGDALVYGANGDVTWDEAAEAEQEADAAAKRLADFKSKQVGLPIE